LNWTRSAVHFSSIQSSSDEVRWHEISRCDLNAPLAVEFVWLTRKCVKTLRA